MTKKMKLVKKTSGYDLTIQREGGVMTTISLGVTEKSQKDNWHRLRELTEQAIVRLDHPSLEDLPEDLSYNHKE